MTACMPLVMHEPRVHEGWRFPIAVAAGALPGILDEDPHAIPYLTFGYAYGWANQTTGFSAGVQVPLFPHPAALVGTAVDLYVQPDRTRAAGAGLLVSPLMLMPYAQIGTGGEGGTAWYTTQGVAFSSEDLDGGVLWMPSLAVRNERIDGRRAATVQFTAGVPFSDDEWVAVLAVVFEFARARRP